jgi:hypothetical protein
MKLLVNNPPPHPDCMDFVQPRSFNAIGKTGLWAADNDAFAKFCPDRYLRMLDRIAAQQERPVFVTVPDKVGDAAATYDLWNKWHHELKDRGIPAAFVLQNGVDDHWFYHMNQGYHFPFDEVDAFFIGGDTPFKFTEWVRDFIAVASGMHGKWIHMGRVNSIQRLNYARMIGCDSCDGSGMARFRRTVLVPMLTALDQQVMHLA